MSLDNKRLWTLHMYTSTTNTIYVVPLTLQAIDELVQYEITIGRALSNDVVVMDPAVSREHARLMWHQSGWYIANMTKQNVVHINDQPIPSGTSVPIQAQDIFTLGSTALQLIDHHSFQLDSIKMKSLERAAIQQTALPTRIGTFGNLRIVPVGGVVLMLSIAVLVLQSGMVQHSLLIPGEASTLIIALLISLLTIGAIFVLVNSINRFEPKPLYLRLAAFLWGAVIAAPLAFLLESYINILVQGVLGQGANDIVRFALSALNPSMVEESSKGLGLLLLLLIRRDEFDNVVDGIVYGMLVGAGFTTVENFWYFTYYPSTFLTLLIIERVLLGWLLHSTFTVCFGIALGYIPHIRVRWKHIGLLAIGFLLAVGLHSLFDFVALLTNTFVLSFPDDKRVALYTFLALAGNYILPYVVQIIIVSILVKVIQIRAENNRDKYIFEHMQLVAKDQSNSSTKKLDK